MKAEPEVKTGGNILIVDDTPANLRLLTDMLRRSGYAVRPVLSGRLALEAVRAAPPDLVLLDINMPVMDGYEVCGHLKSDPQWAGIPVIFISALQETLEKVKGFAVGGVDYITKPFQYEEVEARVKTHLEVARLRRELERHNTRLEETVRQRTGQLVEANQQLVEANARLAILDQAKSDFLGLISHELHTPLQGMVGAADILFTACGDQPEVAMCRDIFNQSCRRLLNLVDDALLLTTINTTSETGEPHQCCLREVAREAIAQARSLAKMREVRLGEAPPDGGEVIAAPEFLGRAVQLVLETAVKFAQPGSLVKIRQESQPGGTSLVIETEGRTIPQPELARFFQLLANANPMAEDGDLGLAPALAERIVTLYGGTLTVENLAPPGIRLTVHLKTPAPCKP
jgi:two-component system sensor histidine kinase/response regulator